MIWKKKSSRLILLLTLGMLILTLPGNAADPPPAPPSPELFVPPPSGGDSSMELFERHRDLAIKVTGAATPEVAKALLYHADAALARGRVRQAEQLYQQAMEVGPGLFSENKEYVDDRRREALLDFLLRRPEEAFQNLRLADASEVGDGDRRLLRLTELYQLAYELAVELAATADGPEQEALHERQLDLEAEITETFAALLRYVTADTWRRMAELSRRQGDEQSTLAYVRGAVAAYREWRPPLPPSEHQVLVELLELVWMPPATGDDPIFEETFVLAQLLHWTERLKDRQESFPGGSNRGSDPKVEALIRERITARAEHRELEAELATAMRELEDTPPNGSDDVTPSGPYKGLTLRQAPVKRRVERLHSDIRFSQKRLERLDQSLRDLGVREEEADARVVTASEVRDRLQPGEALLTYVSLPEISYFWVVRHDRTRRSQIRRRPEIEESTGAFAQLLASYQMAFEEQVGIFSSLEPLLANVTRLFVVPDPAIGAVPGSGGSILGTGEPPRRTVSKLPYVAALSAPEKAVEIQPLSPEKMGRQAEAAAKDALDNLLREYAGGSSDELTPEEIRAAALEAMGDQLAQLRGPDRPEREPDVTTRARLDEHPPVRPARTLETPDASPVQAVAFSPDGRTLASGHRDGRVRLWDVRRGRLRVAAEVGGSVRDLVYSPDGSHLACLTVDGSRSFANVVVSGVLLLDLDTGEALDKKVGSFQARISSFDFSPDARYLIYAGFKALERWDLETGESLYYIGPEKPLEVTYSPDGQWIASGNSYPSISLWDARRDEKVRLIDDAHEERITGVVFSLDGELLASSSDDGSVRLWRVADGHPLAELRRAGTDVASVGVAFSPDGRWLASLAKDNKILLWELRTRQLARRLEVPASDQAVTVHDMAIDARSKWIAGAADRGRIYLWRLDR